MTNATVRSLLSHVNNKHNSELVFTFLLALISLSLVAETD